MKHRWMALLGALALSAPAWAGTASHVQAQAAWIRVLPGTLPAGGYVTLRNDGDAPATLTGAESTAYAMVMLHESSRAGGMSRMHDVPRLSIPAHASQTLAPGGYHLMLSHAKAPVAIGSRVRVTLEFADGSTLPVDFIARPASALGPTD